MRILAALVIAAMAFPAFAQSTAHPKPKDLQVVDDVPPPPRVEAGKSLPEPVVTTRKEGDDTVQEYRIGGKLYQQKVQPAKGPPYYLIDEKGEGKFTRVDGPDVKLSVPMWVILTW